MKKRIVVIGGGPGGYVAAIRAAQLGAETHLVEGERVGGTCLNVGCIPTKALLHTAELFQAVKKGAVLGVKAEGLTLDWPAVQRRKTTVVNRLVQGVEGLLKANGVNVHCGYARLQDARTVTIDGKPVADSADAVILATGSESVKLNFPGAELPGVIDSTAALSLPQVPGSMIIIGGGVIGVEFASLYSAFGTKVTVVEMLPEILPGIDGEIAAQVHTVLERQGITFLTGTRLESVAKQPQGLCARIATGDSSSEALGEVVLVAVGRRPRTAGIGLEDVGVSQERGRVQVNDNFRTNVPGIYAIGDCNGQVMLAHTASAQGVAAVEHALGHSPVYCRHIIPACIYTHPEVASVGLSEDQARGQGLDYKKGVFPLAGNGKAVIEGGGTGLVKIISGKRHGEILGVQIFGPRATDLIAEAALAIRLEATVDELTSTIHAHPTISEALAEAALAVDNSCIHFPPAKR